MEYSIGEFAKLVGLSEYTLRYYEKEGIISLQRNRGQRRFFSEDDINWLDFIKRLKDTGMPLKEIREYARLRQQGPATMAERLSLLRRHKAKVLKVIADWRNNLDNLKAKIAFYEENINSEP